MAPADRSRLMRIMRLTWVSAALIITQAVNDEDLMVIYTSAKISLSFSLDLDLFLLEHCK
jgi:hypothetical protein